MTLPNVPQAEGMSPEVRRYLDAVKREIEATIVDLNALVIPSKATEAQAVAGSDDTNFLTPLSGVAAVKAHSPFVKFAHYQDQETSGTAGGGFTSGAWQTRTLNTEVYDNIGLSLSSNELSLVAGDYFIWATAPGYRVGGHQVRIYNVTDASAILTGTTEFAIDSGALTAHQTSSMVRGHFTLAATKSVRLEHRCTTTKNTDGFGVAHSFGTEVYADLMIWKLS